MCRDNTQCQCACQGVAGVLIKIERMLMSNQASGQGGDLTRSLELHFQGCHRVRACPGQRARLPVTGGVQHTPHSVSSLTTLQAEAKTRVAKTHLSAARSATLAALSTFLKLLPKPLLATIRPARRQRYTHTPKTQSDQTHTSGRKSDQTHQRQSFRPDP